MKTRLILLGWVLVATACGGSDLESYEGVYAVTHHTINDTGCDAEGPAVNEFSHFQLTLDELFGQEYLSFGECTSADPASCQSGGLFSSFVEQDGELVHELSASSGGGAVPCILTLVRGVATRPTGDSLRIETRRYSETDPSLSEAECDPDTAQARGSSMPCEELEVLEGSEVP